MKNAKSILLGLVSAFAVAACGGGAQTTDLPPPQTGGGPTVVTYQGVEAARDADVLRFQQTLWHEIQNQATCGDCHNENVGESPMFARFDNINDAYDAAVTVTNSTQPSLSRLAEKVGLGHNCWVGDPAACSANMTRWIEDWLGAGTAGGRQIILTPPASVDPGDSKNFPDTADGPPSFTSLIWQPILVPNCSGCHSSQSANAIQPYFADPDVDAAYEAAKSKIELDDPAASRFVVRLRDEFHNCWSGSCAADANTMETAITAYAGAITPTQVDPSLVTSKALRLVDGTVASGGNRYENDLVALWEFKTGSGLVAFDTSGVAPALDLNLSGDVEWFGGWGITINDGKAQGSTANSAKINTFIQQSGGAFSIEAWVIPANVSQEMSRIVTYSAGTTARNFSLQQTLYNYDFQLRTTETSLNGDPALSTPDAAEVLQATLQHVVATYDPVDGRQIYVNGTLVTQTDPVAGGTIGDWQDTFAFVLGNEASNDGLWQGTFRLVAIHDAVLTQSQIQQNFDAGVGERFYLLFDISEILFPGDATKVQTNYVLFEVAQYDTYAYLFDKPHYITLDGSAPPTNAQMRGMRVAMNGQEVEKGQTYATVDMSLAVGTEELGQPLSILGAVLPLEKGPDSDEFFLTFDELGPQNFTRDEDPSLFVDGRDQIVNAANLPAAAQVGLRTFDEIDATYAAVTGVDRTTYQSPAGVFPVNDTYQELRQSLPAVEDINTFVSSHQVAIAQLAIEYCNALVEGPTAGSYFSGLNLDGVPGTVLAPGPAGRDLLVNPLIENIVGNQSTGPQIDTQPDYSVVYAELASVAGSAPGCNPATQTCRPANLVDRLIAGGSSTRAIAKGVCAATLGSAVTLAQ